MKTLLLTLLFVASAAVGRSLGAGGTVLVQDGTAVARVYVNPADFASTRPDQPAWDGRKLKDGLDDFLYHVERMSGSRMQVVEVAEPSAVVPPAIVVGSLAGALGAQPPVTRWKEGYRMVAKEGFLLIQGETPRAATYGMYALLEKLGCDWVMPGPLGEIIPTKKTIQVAFEDKSDAPAFGMRRFWYRGGSNIILPGEVAELAKWNARQRMQTADELEENGAGHMWDHFISLHPKEIEASPNILALVRGADGTLKRSGPQIETTNPKVIELMVDDIRKTFEERHWAKDKAVTLPIGPADGGGYSISPESLAAGSGLKDSIMGGNDETDIVVKLANDVLEKAQGEFPNLSLGYFIYSVHAGFPVKYIPNPKVFPIFAPISYSRLNSTTDENSFSRVYYKSILERWVKLAGKQGNRMIIYEYNWNLADNMLPFTRVRMFGEDVPMYYRMGFSGLTIEATKAWAVNGAGDYALAKLAWNPSLDWKSLLHQYCEKAFGEGGRSMERYYLRLVEQQHGAGQEAGSYFSAPLIFDTSYLDAAEKDIQAALHSKLSKDERVRVEAVAFTLSTLKQYLAWHYALGRFDFAAAEEEYAGMLANWNKELAINSQLVAREVPIYMEALLHNSTLDGLKYSTEPYKLVFPISDLLPTCLDPTGHGAEMNLQGSRINDRDWIKSRTFTSTWAAQGLGLYREGAVWYHVHFKLPEGLGDRAIGLFLGGFEDEARVWVNDRAVGKSGIKFANPAVFDLTDGIKKDGDNVLAIQIIRNSNLNENFLGGLLRPSFIFAGPRVTAEVPTAEEYRVLPGGEREKIKH